MVSKVNLCSFHMYMPVEICKSNKVVFNFPSIEWSILVRGTEMGQKMSNTSRVTSRNSADSEIGEGVISLRNKSNQVCEVLV